MDSVVHFEILTQNTPRAQKFYKETFGWSFSEVPEMKYSIITTTETDKDRMPKNVGRINGGMMNRDDKLKSPVITIAVKDVDRSIEMIKKNGGKIIVGKQVVGDIGFSAYFQDTEGNILGLFQSIKQM